MNRPILKISAGQDKHRWADICNDESNAGAVESISVWACEEFILIEHKQLAEECLVL